MLFFLTYKRKTSVFSYIFENRSKNLSQRLVSNYIAFTYTYAADHERRQAAQLGGFGGRHGYVALNPLFQTSSAETWEVSRLRNRLEVGAFNAQ